MLATSQEQIEMRMTLANAEARSVQMNAQLKKIDDIVEKTDKLLYQECFSARHLINLDHNWMRFINLGLWLIYECLLLHKLFGYFSPHYLAFL